VEELESLCNLIRIQNGTDAIGNNIKIPQKIKNRTTI
jgi:hypothetical protein